jgi:isopenicillin-N epimerase
VRTADEIRSDFLLDPDVVFLNHGSFGATPQPVLDRQLEHQRALFDTFRIEVPMHRVDERTLVRLSVQAYTTDEDCERLVEALAALV